MTAFAGLTMLLITAAAIAQDSLNKRRIGEILPSWDAAQDVKVQGNFAYVAAGTAGLYILNVSNPAAPVQMGSFGVGAPSSGVTVAAEHLFVSATSAGLRIFALTNPSQPSRRAITTRWAPPSTRTS